MMSSEKAGEQPGGVDGGGHPSGSEGGGTLPKNKDVVGNGELRSSRDRRTGYISGTNTFGVKRVVYSAVNGIAVFEGDIALGPLEKVEKSKATADTSGMLREMPAGGLERADPNVQHAVAIVGQRYRWPDGMVPYEFQQEIADTVAAAIKHWEERTSIRFIARSFSNASAYPNYVSFEVRDGCWSAVGMQGGMQVISLGPGCGAGQAIHEIGHAVGLWHEQGREDRDQYVQIVWDKIITGMEHNFNQHITDGDDIGDYDYGSVMHYPPTAFSATGEPTILALRDGQEMGQRNGLSDGDVSAVAALYPSSVRGSHFYTTSLLELQTAVTQFGFRNDGVACYAYGVPVPGLAPLYRLSRPKADILCTTSLVEVYDAIAKKGYTLDGVACYVFPAPAPGLTPLYRLGKDKAAPADHLYTTSPTEVHQAVAEFGYEGEGIAGYVLSLPYPGTVPVYRLTKAA